MKRNYRLTSITAGMVIAGCAVSYAADPIELTFTRTGTDAASVTTTVSGADGVTAQLLSVSHDFKATANDVSAGILCPNVNGNTSPTITFTFSIAGLPANYTFDTVGLWIHALNNGGNYQQSDDNRTRQFNVAIETGNTTSTLSDFASLSDIDIAAGISGVNQVWEATATKRASATDPLIVNITVTKGTTNEGCFFGLSSVILSDSGEEHGTEVTPEPTPDPTPDTTGSKVYTIKWKNSTSSYMTESGNGIVISSYATSSPCFWEFIPTENENCYYIRNTASGRYIGSCNLTPSSASKISMTDTPVEYYMGTSASTSGENKGCVWLSSTDCSNYSTETSGARCLNKDGASTSIITWTTGLTNYGSYWTLTETGDLYEPKPFTAAAAIGAASLSFYHIVSPTGQSLATDQTWVAKKEELGQKWYFVGTGNQEGGYQIVDAATNTPLQSGAQWIIKDSKTTDGYYNFFDANGNALTINGVSDFKFVAFRSAFAMASQIYNLPCGTIGSNWLTQATIKGDGSTLYYPQPTKGSNGITYPTASKPSARYTILSKDAAAVSSNGADVTLKLNAAPATGTQVLVYVDWDRDGLFEDSQELTAAQSMTAKLTPTADAKAGLLRMRVRITDNGLTDAEDDVNGQVVDFMINYTGAAAAATIAPTIEVNDVNRGTAEYDAASQTATAAAKSSSLFLYWMEGTRLLSVDQTLSVEPLTVSRTITAVFSPNLDDIEQSDICSVLQTADNAAKIIRDGRTISVKSAATVHGIYVFTLNGSVAAHNFRSTTLSLDNLSAGIYVVKAITANGVASSKIILQ
jgi:hypothetical protein